jgi:hypothetical protein
MTAKARRLISILTFPSPRGSPSIVIGMAGVVSIYTLCTR